jgi:hypothetical protein
MNTPTKWKSKFGLTSMPTTNIITIPVVDYVHQPIILFKENLCYSFKTFIFNLYLLSLLLFRNKITGTIVNENGVPLAGATITIKGTNFTTLSLNDGSFSLTVKKGDVLEISFVGYKSQQIKTGNEANLKIVLQAAMVSLDEVVVTGYTSQKIKEITGSVAVVRQKDLCHTGSGGTNVTRAGAGLIVITSGLPSGASSVRCAASAAWAT